MNNKMKWGAQLILVLLCALGLKFFYSSASPEGLRWILAPTTGMVELVSGRSFTFEAHAGYMSKDHSFLIAGSCAGVNFLVTAFLMLALRKLWVHREHGLTWRFLPLVALGAFVATLLTNTIRICIALQMQQMGHSGSWLTESQLHRAEGIIVYFSCLFILFVITEERSRSKFGLLSRAWVPLLIYYATTLGLPILNGAYRQGSEFWQHAAFVLALPFILLLPLIVVLLCRACVVKTFLC
jgi:exosortase K